MIKNEIIARLNDHEIKHIEDILEYEFRNPLLLSQAFIHSSARADVNNEILEFIGDRALDLVVTKILTDQYSELLLDIVTDNQYITYSKTEAKFTEYKSYIVQSSSLAHSIKKLGLEKYLITQDSETNSYLNKIQSIQENLFEAIIGAVTLDCAWDIPVIENVVRNIHNMDEYLFECDNEGPALEYCTELERKINFILVDELPFNIDRSVNLLQELWQKGMITEPKYYYPHSENGITKDRFDNGDPKWHCECNVNTSGEIYSSHKGVCTDGKNKTYAKKIAALNAIKKLYESVALVDPEKSNIEFAKLKAKDDTEFYTLEKTRMEKERKLHELLSTLRHNKYFYEKYHDNFHPEAKEEAMDRIQHLEIQIHKITLDIEKINSKMDNIRKSWSI